MWKKPVAGWDRRLILIEDMSLDNAIFDVASGAQVEALYVSAP